jgi:hypothetical protein
MVKKQIAHTAVNCANSGMLKMFLLILNCLNMKLKFC